MPETLMDQLIRHEGLRLMPYTDTAGKLTIGVGRNLTDCGISKDEAIVLLASDVAAAVQDLETFAWYPRLIDARRNALIDMRFNLGPRGFRQFVGMLAALQVGDFQAAAASMRASLWQRQTGGRVLELARMVETGTFPGEYPQTHRA